ncbi:MAG: hypothetical protein LUD02_08490 [Tannerellaceae bacterium]|nr:hypothetical protein [Tannerellaceae bacterium]
MEIIKATIQDIPAIQAVAGEVWPKTFAGILSPGQIRYMMEMMYSTESLTEQLTRLGHHYLLVKEGDEYLGIYFI